MDTQSRLGEFEALVLAAVIRGGDNANGAAVYQDITTMAGAGVSLPAVHVTLKRLTDKGLLRSVVGTPSDRGGRPRRYYRATPEGVRAAMECRDMWRRVWRGVPLPDGRTGR